MPISIRSRQSQAYLREQSLQYLHTEKPIPEDMDSCFDLVRSHQHALSVLESLRVQFEGKVL